MARYDPKKIEKKWQKRWLKEKIYEPDFNRAKRPFYNLMMFPYPSAEGLHIGAVRTFGGVDIYGRFKRMQGYDVFEPIGLDGFGIHSENYALKIGKHPLQHAKDSQKNFYRQLGNIGNGFAWDERLETYDPDYYKWTQWIFVQMFKRGLAYRKKAAVNWCPSCKTVLADEQVLQGECERCEAEVVKKELEQWFFKITDYAEQLLKNLDKIDWSESIKIAQRNWIGRSEGALIAFKVIRSAQNDADKTQTVAEKIQRDSASGLRDPATLTTVHVFTTRPDTLFGATYMVLAPEHPLVKKLESRIQNLEEAREYVKKAKLKTDEERIAEGKEKTGVELKGVEAINPANRDRIPVWVADYVLGNVGTGAIMAVPAHDERDFEFAKKYNLSIRDVVAPVFTDHNNPPRDGVQTIKRKQVQCIVKHWSEDKYLCLKWKKYNWQTFVIGGVEEGEDLIGAGKREIREEAGYTDINFVRQLGPAIHARYFANHKGENRSAEVNGLYFELRSGKQDPVSIEEAEQHSPVWIEKDKVKDFVREVEMEELWTRLHGKEKAYTGEGILVNSGRFSGLDSEKAKWEITKFVGGERKVQYRLRDWLISRQRYWGPPIPMIYCEKCNWQPVPEKDLPVKLPYIKDFRPTGTEKSPLATVAKFYKVKCPECGAWARRETDVSDTFLDSAWYYLRYPSVGDKKHPWDSKITKKWFPVDMYIGGPEHAVLHLLYVRFLATALHDFGMLDFEEPFKKFRTHGLITKDGAKMSKSRGNVVSPDEYIRAYGIDAIRMYLAFLAPLHQGGDFRDTGIRGLTRFLERVWKLASEKSKLQIKNQNLQRTIHKTIKKVTEDIETLQYNTAISALMVLLNKFEERGDDVAVEDWKVFLKLLAPFAPFITEELWQQNFANAKKFKSTHVEPWPRYDPKLIQEETFELVIQVNGKVRGRVTLSRGAGEAEAKKAALGIVAVKQHIPAEPRKVVYISNRLINFVV